MRTIFTVRLKAARERKGIMQKEAAKQLGFEYQRYNHLETGRNEPDLLTIAQLAKFYEVSTDYLLGLTDDMTPFSDTQNHGQNTRLQRKISITDTETAAEVENYLDYLEAQKNSSKTAASK